MRSYSEQGTKKVDENGTAFTVDYRSAEHGGREYYMGRDSDGGWIFSYVDTTSEAAQPKTIKFEARDCRRCDGAGRSTNWGLSRNTCFACGGAGSFLTDAGQEARKAYDAAFETTFAELPIGALLRLQQGGKVFRKDAADALDGDRKVWRADAALKLRVMQEIAANYPGATLVY